MTLVSLALPYDYNNKFRVGGLKWWDRKLAAFRPKKAKVQGWENSKSIEGIYRT